MTTYLHHPPPPLQYKWPGLEKSPLGRQTIYHPKSLQVRYGSLITGALGGSQEEEMQIFQNKCLRLALGITYQDGMRTIDLHDLTNIPMIKTRTTALAVKTCRSLENTQCFKDLVLNHEIVQKRSGSPFCVTYQKQWALYHTPAWDKRHSWRISVELLNTCSHREQGLWKELFCVTHEAVSSLS